MKLPTRTLHETRICPIDFRSKDQRSRSQCIDNWKWFMLHNWFPFTPTCSDLSSWNFIQRLPWDEDVPYWFWGHKVKGKGHNALIPENGLCHIIAFPLHLSSWNFIQRLPMSWGCALWILGSKDQRWSSHYALITENGKCCIIAFSFTPIIMKLYIKTPHESRMCPLDSGVKG